MNETPPKESLGKKALDTFHAACKSLALMDERSPRGLVDRSPNRQPTPAHYVDLKKCPTLLKPIAWVKNGIIKVFELMEHSENR